jgi:hypothetical protein
MNTANYTGTVMRDVYKGGRATTDFSKTGYPILQRESPYIKILVKREVKSVHRLSQERPRPERPSQERPSLERPGQEKKRRSQESDSGWKIIL